MSKPPKLVIAACPKCGGGTFLVPYEEQAIERWWAPNKDGKEIKFQEDGYDVEAHIGHLEKATCGDCGKAVDLSGLEQS